MAANTSPIFGLTPNLTEVTFVNADGTTPKTVFTAATDGSLLKAISVCSDDTSAVVMQVFVNDGSTDYLVGSVNIPTLSGTDGSAPAIDLLSGAMLPAVVSGQVFLPTGYSVKVAPKSAVTAAKTVTVVGIGVSY